MQMDDSAWAGLKGGYGIPFDPRPLIRRLESSPGDHSLWDQLGQELYHQGDVGEASYAAIPLIARIDAREALRLVAMIELARTSPNNPPVPAWLLPQYREAIDALAESSLRAMGASADAEPLRAMLAMFLISKDMRS